MTVTLLDRKHTAMMLIVVAAATFMDGLDGSIVSIILPTIAEDMGVDTATSSWATIIYLLVLAALIIPFARMAAQTGVRRILSAGLGLFAIGSLLCGLAYSFPTLIAFRFIQAVGAAMMAASAPMCCTEHLPLERLGFGMSIVTIGASLGFALGPVVGGAISEFLAWHWVFFINIPFGILGMVTILKAIPKDSERGGRPVIDIKGSAVFCSAMVLGVVGVEILSYADMEIYAAACIIACILLFVLFVHVEHKTETPLLKTSMFRNLGFTSVFACLLIMNAAFMAVLYLIPFYGEIVLGKSALGIGYFLLASAIITAVVGMPIARWSDTAGRRGFCIAAGLVVLAAFLTYSLTAEDMSDLELMLGVSLQGVGWGLVGGPMASRLVEHAGDERDMASSMMNEAYYVGGALGTAFAAMLFTIMSGAEGIDISLIPADMFVDGFVPVAVACAVMSAVVALLSFLLKDDIKSR